MCVPVPITKKTAAARAISVSVEKVPVTVHRHAAIPLKKQRDQYLSALEHPSKMIDIDCEAVKCIYNSDYKCNADNVKIGGSNACDCQQTSCATFRER